MLRTPAAVNTASNAAVNLASAPDQELEAVSVVLEAHERVAGLLGHPLPAGSAVILARVHARPRRASGYRPG
jgi:hypothetical protein